MSGDKQMKRRAFVQAAAGSGLLAAVGTPALAADPTPTPTPDGGDDGGSGLGSGLLGDIGAATTDTFVFSPATTVLSWVTGDSNQSQKEALQREAYHDVKRFKKSISRTLNYQESTYDYVFDGIFGDAKKRAIREINDTETKQTVEDEALSVARAQVIKLQQNIITALQGLVDTYSNYIQSAEENGMSPTDVMRKDINVSPEFSFEKTESYELLDGSQMDVPVQTQNYESGSTNDYNFLTGSPQGGVLHPTMDSIPLKVPYLGDMMTDLEDKWANDLKPDIKTWVANAYDAVASGNINAGELMTANDLSRALSESEPANRAIGSLRAAGVDGGESHAVTLSWSWPDDSDVTVTVYDAVLGSTGQSASVSEGNRVTPSSAEYQWLLNYSPSDLEIDWGHYETQIDGGTATITKTPAVRTSEWVGQDMTMQITTTHGETVSLDPYAHGDPANPSAGFEVDLTEQLEKPITEIKSLTIYTDIETDPSSTRFLKWPFTVKEIGGDVSELNFEHDREIHTTDNYLTKEEWEQRRDDLAETQDDVSDGPAGGGINLPDWDFGDLPGVGLAGGIVSALLTLVIGGVGLFVMVVLLIVLLGSVSG